MQNRLPEVKLGVYRHYKGKRYRVIGVGTETETREVYVVYKHLYDTPGYDENALWLRPYEMFTEKVTVDGKRIPRFEYIGEKDE